MPETPETTSFIPVDEETFSAAALVKQDSTFSGQESGLYITQSPGASEQGGMVQGVETSAAPAVASTLPPTTAQW